eukprot:136213-Chlamydomonas_euryale.AAC.1
MAALQQMGPLGMRTDGGANPGGSGQALAFLTRPSVTNAEAVEGVSRLQWEQTGAKPHGLLDG